MNAELKRNSRNALTQEHATPLKRHYSLSDGGGGDAANAIADAAKKLIADVMTETRNLHNDASRESGNHPPSVSVSATTPKQSTFLRPMILIWRCVCHRTAKRASANGTMRITAAKVSR